MPKPAPRPGKKPRPPDLSQPLEEWTLEVYAPDDGLRLDTFLSRRITWRSRSSVQQLIREGRVYRKGRPGRSGEKVKTGDHIVLDVDDPTPAHDGAAAIALDVIYEDACMVVLNKQPGVLVHPVGAHRTDTLMAALHARYREAGDADRVPKLCHRLDRDTSGVWVVALDDAARAHLGAQFEERRARKEYYALVRREVEADAFEVRLAISHDRESVVRLKRKAGPDPEALPAHTDVRVVERFPGATAVACRPRTGRTHQIRVHCAGIGHPLLGDPLYGPEARPDRWLAPHHGTEPLRDAAGTALLHRQALHARRLELIHPETGAPVTFEAALPPDLERTAAWLRTGAMADPG